MALSTSDFLTKDLTARRPKTAVCAWLLSASLPLASTASAQEANDAAAPPAADVSDGAASSGESGSSDTAEPGDEAGASASFQMDASSDEGAIGGMTASADEKEHSSQNNNRPVPEYAGARATHRRSAMTVGERFRQLPYIERYRPEGNLWEIGMFGGVFFPSSAHNLKVTVLPREEYSNVAMQVGGSVAYFPLSFLGAELEAFGGGGSTATSNYSAVFYGARAHAILQLPLFSVVPFVLVGGGALAASSETMGHDRDPAFHFGGGMKIPFNHLVGARFDVRDTLSQKGNGAANGKQTHYPEIHLGLTFTFDRTPPEERFPDDIDYDGLYDSEDQCPEYGALTVDGCPVDSDGDGLLDGQDACPQVPSSEPDGCPDLDKDGDGVALPADQCPDEQGPRPSGCPEKDADGDGFIGAADKCPKAPETRNGFEDDDGCPDEMPEAITRFTGVIPGINFKVGTADIEEASFETLDAAVEILKKHPSIRIEVSGHTSSEGTTARNQELSNERAEAVRKYFIDKGVEADRVAARGAGSSEPVADNGTPEGRKQNRRIEFRILAQP